MKGDIYIYNTLVIPGLWELTVVFTRGTFQFCNSSVSLFQTYLPKDIAPGEELTPDMSAYEMLHTVGEALRDSFRT